MREPRAGDLIGPYRVVRPLGSGGMGRLLVVQAEGTPELALKLIKLEDGWDEPRRTDALRRFRREVMLLMEVSELNHPHIVKLVQSGMHEGEPYLVTELVEGDSLSAVLWSGKHRSMQRAARSTARPVAPSGLPVTVVEACARQLVDALATLHASNITHRDLKPENIMATSRAPEVRSTGEIHLKLIDFGIGLSDDATRLTKDLLPGTLLYIAPELFSADTTSPEDITHAQARDAFALGLILYELWTGSRLWTFRGNNGGEPILDASRRWQSLLGGFHANAGRLLLGCPVQGLIVSLLSAEPGRRMTLEQARSLLSGAGRGADAPAGTGDLGAEEAHRDTHGSAYRRVEPTLADPIGSPGPDVLRDSLSAGPQRARARRWLLSAAGMGVVLGSIVVATIGGLFELPPAPGILRSGEVEAGTLTASEPPARPADSRPLSSEQPTVVPETPKPTHAQAVVPKPETRSEQPDLAEKEPARPPTPSVKAAAKAGDGHSPSSPSSTAERSGLPSGGSHQLAAVPRPEKVSKLALNHELLFASREGVLRAVQPDQVRYRADAQQVSARAMAPATVRSLEDCTLAAGSCVVELAHEGGAFVSRYEGCRSTLLQVGQALSAGEAVCPLRENDLLTVRVLGYSGQGSGWQPVATKSWPHLQVQ